MGQATVDLPDPQKAPSPSAGADDLLAQMAGAEIDRLLAEAESGNPPAAKSDAPLNYGDVAGYQSATENSASPELPGEVLYDDKSRVEPADEADANFNAQTNGLGVAAAKASAEVGSNDPLASELDSLLNSLTTPNTPPVEPVPVPPAHAVEAEEVAATPAFQNPAALSTESAEILSAAEAQVVATGELSDGGAEETSLAERSALTADSAEIDALKLEIPETKEYRPFQFLVRPLEWINAPINACPDLLREFIGKAAILTVVNAVALLFYVHFIRRH